MERIHWALHFFLSGRKTLVQSVWCCRAGLNLWMREVCRLIYLSGFREERANPVKGDLANFEWFCSIMPSVHDTLGKCSYVLDWVMIADHSLGLRTVAFPDWLLGRGMSLWHIPILKSHLPLPGWSACILLLYVHASKIKRGCFGERLHQSSGVRWGEGQLHMQVGHIFSIIV